MAKSFFELLQESDEPIVQASIKDWDDWKKITKKNKETLEAILRFKLCEITYTSEDHKKHTSIVTSDTRLIKMVTLKKGANTSKELKSIVNMGSTGIHCRESFMVMTWDLLKGDFIKVSSNRWNINACKNITISEDNISILNKIFRDIIEHLKNDKH